MNVVQLMGNYLARRKQGTMLNDTRNRLTGRVRGALTSKLAKTRKDQPHGNG